ncbi:hypothetical protein LQU73_10100 [Actinobacillus pleuropneumoniae]|uniref:hypothetical protein n=1 Tax=Actinobacillus pleuropneumoniae TaxID=715 RepID=UPI0020214092|nr:hypothetical protein [Actinobacillus pleuropneumoniae]MCL7722210.1 hypothetical protein [Actinobacillus pleuropneumoniae]MCL7730513.1 hypothetical protein [Actinobacillus pleuropneumoniae]
MNAGESEDNFENFILDFVEDAGALSDKYEFKENLGRPRTWHKKYIYIKFRILLASHFLYQKQKSLCNTTKD